jgi:hypothetical protein
VPNRETSLDDQVSRARFAAAAGAALIVEDPDGDDLDRVLDRAVRPEVREQLARRCAELRIGNGAAAAARWLVGLADPHLADPHPAEPEPVAPGPLALEPPGAEPAPAEPTPMPTGA